MCPDQWRNLLLPHCIGEKYKEIQTVYNNSREWRWKISVTALEMKLSILENTAPAYPKPWTDRGLNNGDVNEMTNPLDL